MNEFEQKVDACLDQLKKEKRYRTLHQRKGVSFSHNDYLGLSKHPVILDAQRTAIDVSGAGSTGSRLLGGNSFMTERLEDELASFFQSEAALLFSSGYLANLAATQVASLLSNTFYSDEFNHASLIDGQRLTKKEIVKVPHKDGFNLLLNRSEPGTAIFESLYSMEGDFFSKPLFLELQKNENLFFIIDEAHSAGLFEEAGRGWLIPLVKDWSRTVVTVTFGKTFGQQGACLLCSHKTKDLLINVARSFIFDTALCPALVAGIAAAVELMPSLRPDREQLWSRAEKLRSFFRAHGMWVMGDPRSPILPVRLEEEIKALSLIENMQKIGVDLKWIRYPTVAKGAERIRLSLSLDQSEENTWSAAHYMVELWKASSLLG